VEYKSVFGGVAILSNIVQFDSAIRSNFNLIKIMRPRINNKVDVQSVIDSIERRVKVYSECIRDIMQSEQVEYQQAKQLIEKRTLNNLIFKS
jgi:hypothetical protein